MVSSKINMLIRHCPNDSSLKADKWDQASPQTFLIYYFQQDLV